jgi:signal transduction histidine kinase
MTGATDPYVLDGGLSHEIQAALHTIINESRIALEADFAVVTYRPHSSVTTVALASSTRDGGEFFRPNEPLIPSESPIGKHPLLAVDMQIRSLLRQRSLRLSSAIVVPWSDECGVGALIVGNSSLEPLTSGVSSARRSVEVVNAVHSGRTAGMSKIRSDLHAALKEVAEANACLSDAESRLAAILHSAKRLFNTEVSYLAMPQRDKSVFTFTQTLGIHTPAFRGLKVEEGQGLGGLARLLQRPVRSLDYSQDDQLKFAFIAETQGEGIVSAMAAPVMVDGEVSAVIYIGDRRLRAFSETDERILEEFTGFATLGLEQLKIDEYRGQVIKREERERLAYAIHDSVVRRLVEIGYVVDESRRSVTSPEAQRHFAAIEKSIESAMDALRGQLSQAFVDEDSTGETDAYRVINKIMELRHVPGITRSHGENIERRFSSMSVPAANALIRVGQEAVVNAERHSGCNHIHVQLDLDAQQATLSIRDNGRGMPLWQLENPASSLHFGVGGMQEAVHSVGGLLTFGRTSPFGLTVTAHVDRLRTGKKQ